MIVSFHTLGCKTNAYETQAILEQFREHGFETGNFSDPCDVYIINTCAVTAEAARKSRQITGRCRRLNPDALVVVTGCYAQEAPQELIESCGADFIVGNGEKSRIIDLVKQVLEARTDKEPDRILIDDQLHMRIYEEQKISSQEEHVRAYVKIQDGCDRFCSYCIIPYLRGRSRSRKFSNILEETERLAAAGMKEIVLTGIDISSFRTQECESAEQSLSKLIKMISGINGIERIRLGSLEAGIVSEELLEQLGDILKFCPQFHLSLQSGCDSVLKRMNRHYTSEQFAECVDMIRKHFPDAALTTDIIAGFPGESEEEFDQTLEFVKRIRFSRIHAFPYSRRKGTRADLMSGQLSKTEKEERTRRLIELGEKLRIEYESGFIGKNCEVLIEEEHADPDDKACCFEGYTKEYVRVRILTDRDLYGAGYTGKTVRVAPCCFEKGCLTARNFLQP